MSSSPFVIAEVSVDGCSGLLGLHPCPGKREAGQSFAEHLDEDVKTVLYWGAEAVVTLMEPNSLVRDGASHLGDTVVQQGMQWFHLPIQDNAIPTAEFDARWPGILARLNTLLDQGKRISLHCRGGTGRTSLLAALLLLERGESWADVESKLRAARPNALTVACQRDYLQQRFGLAD